MTIFGLPAAEQVLGTVASHHFNCINAVELQCLYLKNVSLMYNVCICKLFLHLKPQPEYIPQPQCATQPC